MQKDKVSVIIPAYNASLTIEKCIRSVLSQIYSPIEIIVVNDGSKDNTLEIITKINKETFGGIKIIDQKNNGVSEARNRAIAESTGKYICFLDSDDTYAADYIESCTKLLFKYDVQMLVTAFNTVENNEIIGRLDYISPEKTYISTSDYLDIMLNYHDQAYWGANWNKMYVASIIKENRLKFQKGITIGEDLYFNLQYLMYVDNIVVVHEPNQNYQIDTSGSLSKLKRNPLDYWKQYVLIYHLYLELCHKKQVPNIERLNAFAFRMIFETAYMTVVRSKASFKQFKIFSKENFELFLKSNQIKTEKTLFLWRVIGKLIQKHHYLWAYVLIKIENCRRSMWKRVK